MGPFKEEPGESDAWWRAHGPHASQMVVQGCPETGTLISLTLAPLRVLRLLLFFSEECPWKQHRRRKIKI